MEFISDVSIITMANVSTLVDNYLSDSTEQTPDVGVEGLVEEQASEPEQEPEQEQEQGLDVQVPKEEEQQQEEAKEEEVKEQEEAKEEQEEEAKEEEAQEEAKEEEGTKEIKKDEEKESRPEEEVKEKEDSTAASVSVSAWIVCFSNRPSIKLLHGLVDRIKHQSIPERSQHRLRHGALQPQLHEHRRARPLHPHAVHSRRLARHQRALLHAQRVQNFLLSQRAIIPTGIAEVASNCSVPSTNRFSTLPPNSRSNSASHLRSRVPRFHTSACRRPGRARRSSIRADR